MLKNNKGITLVELLIVIVILGIIAAIAVPAVGNIVENARVDAFISEGRTIASSANVGCTTEEWDGCDTWSSDSETRDEAVLTPEELVDGGYLEGFDPDGDFKAFRYQGTWYVAWEYDGYFAAGDPADIERDDVYDFSENLDDKYGEDIRSLGDIDDSEKDFEAWAREYLLPDGE